MYNRCSYAICHINDYVSVVFAWLMEDFLHKVENDTLAGIETHQRRSSLPWKHQSNCGVCVVYVLITWQHPDETGWSSFGVCVIHTSVVGITKALFLAATKQLYEWFSTSLPPSVGPSVTPCSHHCFIPSLYHHEIFRRYHQWQKWCPCKRSKLGWKV